MYEMEILAVIFGLVIGSFLNVCIYRIPRGMSVVAPPSHCTGCDKRLSVLDLVPVISYLILQGKCRQCGAKISPRYPLVELFCGAGFLLLYINFGLTVEFLAGLVLFSGLVVCSLIDLDHRIIPDGVNLTLGLIAIPLLLVQSTQVLLNGVFGALVGFGLLLLIAVASKGGMGGGDIKLAAVLGLYLGWPNIILALFIAFILGSVVGLIWVWVKQKTLKEALPFGPFLSIAALVVLLWGTEIINWYLNLM